MYLSETLARDRHRDQLDKAHLTRIARQAAELRKLERIKHRAERKALRAWRRADELRALIEAAG
jgi:hypothetical protein